jgi:hypothetical protein
MSSFNDRNLGSGILIPVGGIAMRVRDIKPRENGGIWQRHQRRSLPAHHPDAAPNSRADQQCALPNQQPT